MTEVATEFTVDELPAEELAQLNAALSFNLDLVAANHKALFNSIAALKADMWNVPIEDLRILPDFNVRLRDASYYAHVRNIANSISENGFYKDKPLCGFGGLDGKKPVIYIIDGHCRLEALKIAIAEGAPISEVNVILKDKSTTKEDLTVAVLRSGDGKRLTPLEIAIGCQRLNNYGWSNQKTAEKIGISAEYVNQLLTLAGAPQSIRNMVQSGEAAAAVALDAMRSHGSDAAKVMSQALDTAKASGKSKLTARYLPEQIRKKACKKVAPIMYSVIEQVKAHKSFDRLPDDLKNMIDDLISQVNANTDVNDAQISLI